MNTILNKLAKFSEITLNKLFFLWLLGLVINNTHLWKYGAFSFHILDTSNLTSGIPFLFLIIIPCFFVYIFRSSPCFKRNANGKGSSCFIYHYLIPITLLSIIIYFIDSSIGVMFIIIIAGILTGFDLKLCVYHKKSANFSDILETYRISVRPAKRFFYGIVCFILAFLYGHHLHGHVPKIFGGGKHNQVYFTSTPFVDQFVDTGKLYDLIDETENSFLLYDLAGREVLEVPKKIEDSYQTWVRHCIRNWLRP